MYNPLSGTLNHSLPSTAACKEGAGLCRALEPWWRERGTVLQAVLGGKGPGAHRPYRSSDCCGVSDGLSPCSVSPPSLSIPRVCRRLRILPLGSVTVCLSARPTLSGPIRVSVGRSSAESMGTNDLQPQTSASGGQADSPVSQRFLQNQNRTVPPGSPSLAATTSVSSGHPLLGPAEGCSRQPGSGRCGKGRGAAEARGWAPRPAGCSSLFLWSWQDPPTTGESAGDLLFGFK